MHDIYDYFVALILTFSLRLRYYVFNVNCLGNIMRKALGGPDSIHNWSPPPLVVKVCYEHFVALILTHPS